MEEKEFTVIRKKPYRILCLDGGGVRAVMQAVILQRLSTVFPNLLQEVDMFAGTSAGAIVASALAVGIPPEQTVSFYESTAGKIFTEGIYNKVISVDNTLRAPYNNAEMRDLLEREYGTKTLADLTQKILIPTFHLDCSSYKQKEDNQPVSSPARWAPEFFHNLPQSKNADTPLVDAVLRTTAAPTYFPIYQGYIDGGVVANNPSLIAYSTLLASETVQPQDVVVFSLSTGSNPKGIPKSKFGNGDWGLLEWGPHIIDLLLDSSTEAIDYQCRCLLNQRYHRMDPLLPSAIGLDDASAVPLLKEIANKVDLTDTIEWLQTVWKAEQSELESKSIGEEKESSDNTMTSSWRCAIM